MSRPLLLLAAVLSWGVAAAGCRNPLNPEAGYDLPKDPGIVEALVVDVSGRPLEGIWVYVEMPNNVGGVFKTGSPTRATGLVTIQGVPAGRRSVEVKLPNGLAVVGNASPQDVDVVKNKTTHVDFVLAETK